MKRCAHQLPSAQLVLARIKGILSGHIMSHIFISYIKKDISIACEIANGLEAVGYAT